jgi:hypothetical protein
MPLYQKLTNPHPCSGAQMPIDEFFRSTPLPACMTGLIGDWVSAGAPSPAMDGSAIPGG